MDFTKISFTPPKLATTDNGKDKPPKTRLEWYEPNLKRAADGTRKVLVDERVLVSQDIPHPDFLRALQALKRAVADACLLVTIEEDALGMEWERLVVRSVTMKRVGEEAIPCVGITALRELDWCDSPLVLNTPFQPVELVPTEDLEGLLETLRTEAEAFVGGKRAQPDLFEAVQDAADRLQETADRTGLTMALVHEGEETVLVEPSA